MGDEAIQVLPVWHCGTSFLQLAPSTEQLAVGSRSSEVCGCEDHAWCEYWKPSLPHAECPNSRIFHEGQVGERFHNTARLGLGRKEKQVRCLAVGRLPLNSSPFCDPKVARWSRAVFEYKDLWISRRSEQHKRLLGYIQVYDMQGLTWRHYSSREIADKLKTALQSGSFYVEAVSHMYVINASRLFSMVWKAPKPLAG